MDQLPPYPEVPRVVAPQKPSRLFLWLGLGVGALLIATIGGGIFAVNTLIANAPEPVAFEGDDLGCFGSCFTVEDAESLVPSAAALEALGAEGMDGYGGGYRQPIGDVYDAARWEWTDGEGEPSGCSFALSYGPATASNTATTDQRSDPTVELGSFGDESSNVYQLVRVFGSHADGNAYPGQLRESLEGCTHYSVDLGYEERYETDVVPAEISVPFGTATVVAWREYDGYNRITVADLQYANLVVRSIFIDGPGPGISDGEFDAFIAETASAMAALDPAPQSAAPDTSCEPNCITLENLESLVPDADALALLGDIAPTAGYVPAQPQRIGVYADSATATYSDGEPESCAFTMSWAPISPSSPTGESRDEMAVDLGSFGEGTGISQVARLFSSDVWASRYTSSVSEAVKDCPSIRVQLEGEEEPYVAQLVPATFETAPGVSSAAWIETSAEARYTVVDLRFDTVVVRTVLNQVGEATISDEQFAAFVLDTSHRMVALGEN